MDVSWIEGASRIKKIQTHENKWKKLATSNFFSWVSKRSLNYRERFFKKFSELHEKLTLVMDSKRKTPILPNLMCLFSCLHAY